MIRTRMAIAALTIGVMLAACSGGLDRQAGPKRYVEGATFTMALASDPGNLDPSMTASSVTRSMLALSYDSLIYLKDDGTVVSGLARKWRATSTTATFWLKPHITCADGSKLTAKDVADNISYISDPKNKSPLNGVLVHEGTRVAADDAARTVRVTSAAPNGFLLTELSGILMMCRSGLADHGAVAKRTMGTGPWKLDQAVADDHYSFSPRPTYTWGPDGAKLVGKGLPKAVTVRILPKDTTTANLMLNGEVNFAPVAGPDQKRLQRAKLRTIDSISTAGETWFNQAVGRPGADRAVREALTLAVDRRKTGAVATGGDSRPSTGFITLQPNPCIKVNSVKGYLPAVNMTKAATILDDAGWAKGAGGIRAKNGKKLSLTFKYDAQGLTTRTAGVEYLTDQWKKLGVDVRVQALPEAQLNERFFKTGSWDAAWAPFTFNLPSQMTAFVSGPGPAKGGANFSNISNPAYDKAVAAATPKVGTAGCTKWAAAEQALLDDFNVVPLFDSTSHTFLTNAEVTAPGGGLWAATIRMLK